MGIVRWDPFAELASLRREVDKLFEEFFPRFRISRFEEIGVPIDMYHTPEAVVVKAVLPGVKPEDVDITITGNTLTIKGEVKTEKDVRREDYLYQERRYGAFSRSVDLPSGLETDKAEATFEHGILTLTIPKAEEVKPKVIKVKTVK